MKTNRPKGQPRPIGQTAVLHEFVRITRGFVQGGLAFRTCRSEKALMDAGGDASIRACSSGAYIPANRLLLHFTSVSNIHP